MMNRLRTWWQIRTGTEETPFDGDVPAWVVSLVVHLSLLVILTIVLRELPRNEGHVELVSSVVEPEMEVPQEFFFSDLEQVEIGANSVAGVDMAEAIAELEAELTENVMQVEPEEVVETLDVTPSELVIDRIFNMNSALESMPNVVVQGAAGVGATGAAGAIDRITQAIIDSLEDRQTLVVWIFDKSVSLSAQREAIVNRLDRIYQELGVIEASGDSRFATHEDKPLLTAVMGFGENVTFELKKPTDQLSAIKEAVAGIQDDDSGKEYVFQAVYDAAVEYQRYAEGSNRRNVMMIVFTDEAGDDGAEMVDRTVARCQRYRMPVYVVGVPAPFGRQQVEIKWVDPDPEFDQSPQWTPVTQGPESLFPERIKISFSGLHPGEEPLDSGFGPFALTRLAVGTGGMYFSVHPNRQPGRPVRKAETAHLSAYIQYFFDPEKMRRYRPDYVSLKEYERILRKNKAKQALFNAARRSWAAPMETPQLRFPKRSEADLANALTEAQQQPAKLLAGTLLQMYEDLKQGERDRQQIVRPRWQAGYDLAMGRTLALKVRTDGYNRMLAAAKRGMKFKNQQNDTWVLKPSEKILAGSALEKEGQKAKDYLQRVVKDHPGTPWAMLAARELQDPLGWEWTEDFSNVNRPRAGNNAPAQPPRPNDDQRRMLQKKKRRAPPKI
ncbi:MAG: VWA domain-containing protein [Planctomycetales bacterium]|nr:VWA domain-containing protein [Planctomycetales bacterium]NIM09223.1 VWA domain-containing protein [Planctomycetales bacterium]NIN08694.1 VWA domain-containing protein [Planctomycetales bacterium]NIN77809.1 VWA domain-containing protein [Planctomycetales bacterium]NIO34986.1 VWA domain-containing protein [Planctomycetales bacterium]